VSPLHFDGPMTTWLVAFVLACSACLLGGLGLLLAGQLTR